MEAREIQEVLTTFTVAECLGEQAAKANLLLLCNLLLDSVIKFDIIQPDDPSMKEWPVEFFKDGATEPVAIWLSRLPEEVRGKVLARINMLKEHGPTLDHPYTSQVEGRLREVRLRFGKTRYRVLYFFDEYRAAILLHSLTKDTDKLEESDKKIGRDRMVEHSRRVKEAKSKAKTPKKK